MTPESLLRVPREASSRGGKAKTAAKLNALAIAQAKRRDSAERRRQALTVPPGFRNAADFLAVIAEIAGRRIGGRTELCKAAGVDTSKVTKWLKPGSKRAPTQAQLDKLVAWHASLLGDESRPAAPASSIAPGQAQTGPLALAPIWSVKGAASTKLPPEINERLVRTARRRNVTPQQLNAQILDRHLPKLHELES
jgi:hypothetical protein